MKKEKITFECTIDPEIFKVVQSQRKLEDAGELVTITGFSRPVIDKALNFGHIRDSTLETAIIDFYTKRMVVNFKQFKKAMNSIEKSINTLK